MYTKALLALFLVMTACDSAKAPIPLGGDAAGADGVTVTDGAAEIGPRVDVIPGVDSPGEDTVIPEDTIADAPPDAVAPPGCCLSNADCNDPETGAIFVCAGKGLGEPPWAGVCVTPASEEGRCWTDSECHDGQICYGAMLCGCGMDCDMDMWEGPGICVTPGAACQTIQPSWTDEICDAASLVVWDGSACVPTCPGCCGCQGWCEFTFQTIADCQAACVPLECAVFDGGCDDAIPEKPWWYWDGQECLMEDSCVCEGCPGTFATLEQCQDACGVIPTECPQYIAALADSHYTLFTGDDGCPQMSTMTISCEEDTDCMLLGDTGLPDLGDTCVLGNCVWCWNDDACSAGTVCRAGRCVEQSPSTCPDPGSCTAFGCKLITPSESPCPVCTCESTYGIQCETDMECLLYSFHSFSRCVYGRCADCRNDADCAWGRCIQPGLCYEMTPPEDLLFGTWLIGWAGGLNHFSYFRFEPDGTFRRAMYDTTDPMSSFMDDVPPFYDVCDPGWPVPAPLVGTWEPEVTQSGFLVIRVRLNLPCADDQGWTTRWAVDWVDGAAPWSMSFMDIDGDMNFVGSKIDGTTCMDDFSECPQPVDPWF